MSTFYLAYRSYYSGVNYPCSFAYQLEHPLITGRLILDSDTEIVYV